MKKLLLIILLSTLALSVAAEQWKTYKNKKYKYEIQYPDNFEFRLTGRKEERDGKTFRIALKDFSALHGIDGTIYPGMTMAEIAQERKAPALDELTQGPVEQTTKYNKLIWSKITVNDSGVLRREIKSIDTDQLLILEIILDNVEFRVMLWNKCDEKMSEKIISTFRFYD